MIDYEIVFGGTIKHLIKDVRILTDAGWKPLGPATTVPHGYIQTLVRRKGEESNGNSKDEEANAGNENPGGSVEGLHVQSDLENTSGDQTGGVPERSSGGGVASGDGSAAPAGEADEQGGAGPGETGGKIYLENLLHG